MTRGKNHETESLDDIIGLWLERKKSSFKLGHLLSKHLFQMYCALSSPILPLSQERGLRAVRDRSLRWKIKTYLWEATFLLKPMN